MKRMLFCSSLFLLFFASVAFVNPIEESHEIVVEEDFKCVCQGTITVVAPVCEIPTGDFSIRVNQAGSPPQTISSVGTHNISLTGPSGFSISATSECPSSIYITYDFCGAAGNFLFQFPVVPGPANGTVIDSFTC